MAATIEQALIAQAGHTMIKAMGQAVIAASQLSLAAKNERIRGQSTTITQYPIPNST